MLPDFLQLLLTMALVLYIFWEFLFPPWPNPPAYHRSGISFVIVILIVLFWYVIPLSIGHK